MKPITEGYVNECLKSATETLIPHKAEELWEQPVEKAKGDEWYLDGVRPKKRCTGQNIRAISSLAACLAVCFLSFYMVHLRVDTTVFLDVNPSIALQVNCAACDGMFYKNKTVVIAGGGNTAAADALILSRICRKVIVVHRRDTLRATKIYHEPLMKAENVEFRWDSEIIELLHDEKVLGIRLRNVKTGEETTLACDGVFVSIGRKPSSELVKDQVEVDSAGYIIADESTRTNIPGVFAVGDVRTMALRQVVTAVADGATAVHYAEEYLAGGM